MQSRLTAALFVAATMVSGCGAGGTAGACSPPFQEQLDPASDLHLLADEEAEYLTDPPTSGPHGPFTLSDPVLTDPLSRSRQVAVLEAGRTLVQYNDEIEAAAIDRLRAVASTTIVVAPNPGMTEPVVVTAWTWKMTCDGVGAEAVEAITEFAAERADDAPGAD